MHQTAHSGTSLLLSVAIMAVVVALRVRRMRRERPLQLETLWIAPALYAAVALLVFSRVPPHGMGWLYCLAAFALGAGSGWYRGRLVTIRVDPDTHALNQRSSPAAIAFILILIVLRLGTRAMAVEMGMEGAMMTTLTDVLIAFVLGFLPVQRLEMGLRARRLLREARSA